MKEKINYTQRKVRSDAIVEFMIRQWQGQKMWASNLSAVFHSGKTMSDRRRFYFECKKIGLEILNG
jgi:hypothetical protein